MSGDEITVAADTPREVYKGKTYYLCCEHCVEEFQANPEKFSAPWN